MQVHLGDLGDDVRLLVVRVAQKDHLEHWRFIVLREQDVTVRNSILFTHDDGAPFADAYALRNTFASHLGLTDWGNFRRRRLCVRTVSLSVVLIIARLIRWINVLAPGLAASG